MTNQTYTQELDQSTLFLATQYEALLSICLNLANISLKQMFLTYHVFMILLIKDEYKESQRLDTFGGNLDPPPSPCKHVIFCYTSPHKYVIYLRIGQSVPEWWCQTIISEVNHIPLNGYVHEPGIIHWVKPCRGKFGLQNLTAQISMRE